VSLTMLLARTTILAARGRAATSRAAGTTAAATAGSLDSEVSAG
jgi:hypothetical protein